MSFLRYFTPMIISFAAFAGDELRESNQSSDLGSTLPAVPKILTKKQIELIRYITERNQREIQDEQLSREIQAEKRIPSRDSSSSKL